MESLQIDILNPKAKSLLKNLADLNLIKIKKKESPKDFLKLVNSLRLKSDDEISLEDISSEVELVRKKRNEKS